MAASNLNLGKASGGVLSVSPADGTTNTSLVLPASGTVVATDANGNLGLGVSNPANYSSKLAVAGTIASVSLDGNTQSNITADNTGKITIGGYNASNTNYLVFTAGGGAERLRIDASGNVGIGVTPSVSNSQSRNIEFSSGMINPFNTVALRIVQNAYQDETTWRYKTTGQSSTFYNQQGGSHQWYTAPSGTAGNAITWATAMMLDTTSRLSVANGLVSGWNGSSYSATTTGIEDYKVSSYNVTGIYGRTTADTSYVYSALVSGNLKSAILANGNFQSATNSYGGTSDAKLKENVVETSDKLDKLMNVRVVNFNYIGDDQKQIGVIAQEVEKVFPGIVYETKDTEQVEVTKTKEVTDEEGNVTTEEYTETETVETGEVTKNVKYSVIYMMMLKGMQEQQAIINDLKARIEILEGAK